MKFNGVAYDRSSLGEVSPPSETKIQCLNPQRKDKILKVTGWDTMALGSLNLRVRPDILEQLLKLAPAFYERWQDIKYPAPDEEIPKTLGGYFYYYGLAMIEVSSKPILVRRPCYSKLNILELFSQDKLTDFFEIDFEDEETNKIVTVEICGAEKAVGGHPWPA